MDVLQIFVVVLIVAGSVLYSAWRLTSARIHLQFLELLARIPGNPGGRWLARLRHGALQQLSGGCGACSGGRAGQKGRRPLSP
jgi:hypothetical protein